HAHPLSRV
ncbi:hypothetical protein BN1723_020373, partial [Verticillium longisporum]